MSIANNNIEVGDTVRLRWPEHMKKTAGEVEYTVKGIPKQGNNEPTWWTLLGNQSGALFIITEVVMLEVMNP